LADWNGVSVEQHSEGGWLESDEACVWVVERLGDLNSERSIWNGVLTLAPPPLMHPSAA
jgi:hypothetical protein